MEEEVKVSELPLAESVNDEDLVMIVQEGYNKKVSKEVFNVDIADKLQQIETNIELACMTIAQTTSQTLSTTDTVDVTGMQVYNECNNSNNVLTFSNNQITCNRNGKIIVSASIGFVSVANSNALHSLYVVKNSGSTTVARAVFLPGGGYTTETTPRVLVDVQEGDRIYLRVRNQSTAGSVTWTSDNMTSLTVEYKQYVD